MREAKDNETNTVNPMNNYPPGTHHHDADAPWNQPELDYERAQRQACDTEFGHGEWISDFLTESDHITRQPATDLNGPASNVELLSILFRSDVTSRQIFAAIANLRARYLTYAEPLVEKLANEFLEDK